MKAGSTLQQLAIELQEELSMKRDFKARNAALEVVHVPTTDDLLLRLSGVPNDVRLDLCISPHTHKQFSEHLGIPKVYYDRMLRTQPDLLRRSVNAWLAEKASEIRLVRVLGHFARAYLSDAYRPLDHVDLARYLLPILEEMGCEIVSCHLTETRLFIKALNHQVTGEVNVGEVVEAGIIISNSEVGAGALMVQPLLHVLRCKNGLIANNSGLKRVHTGTRTREIETLAWELYRSETLQAMDRALWMQAADLVRATLQKVRFETLLNKLRQAAQTPLPLDAPRAIEVVSKLFSFTDREQAGILAHLIRGGDLTTWGLSNAVTSTAQDVETYERSVQMEEAGFQIIELPPTSWK